MHSHTQNQQQSQACDPLGEIQRVSDLLALQQALNLWLDSGGVGFNSTGGDNELFSSGDGVDNETLRFFCGEATTKENNVLKDLIDRVNYGDSYQQGMGGRERGRERERERGGGGEGEREMSI